MPPQKQPSAKSLEPENEILQAVVVADSFNRRFRPVTAERPRCLLPLANSPVLDYTLEFLAVGGAQEVYIVCCAHADQIKRHIENSKWPRAFKIKILVAPQLLSFGDALRFVDEQSCIRSDFVLVTGDVVSNLRLEDALMQHKARRDVSKDAIMTTILKKVAPTHRTRAIGEEPLFVMDAKTKECLLYEPFEPFADRDRVPIELEALKGHPHVELRNDLIDCSIDICSLEVLALFTENFDYQDLRRDFVRGILESDILGKRIYCHILGDEYAARLTSTKMYDSISKDIISRWVFPVVPDSNIFESSSYQLSRKFVYKERQVKLARTAVLESKVVIGENTEVGANTVIRNSTIGKGCKIGSNVTIDGAYLWDNIEVGSNSVITRSILASNVRVKSSVVIERGCCLSFGVVVGPDVQLRPFTKLAARPQKKRGSSSRERGGGDGKKGRAEADDFFAEELKYANVLGTQGEGHVWEDKEDSEDEFEDIDKRNIKIGWIATDMGDISDLSDEESADESDVTANESEYMDEDDENHLEEIKATMQRAFAENISVENTTIELNTLKMALNSTFHDLRAVVIPCLVEQVDVKSNVHESAKNVFAKWTPLLRGFVHVEEDQVDCLKIVQSHCLSHDLRAVQPAVQGLYTGEVVDEDVLLRWFERLATTGDEGEVRKLMARYIQWLREASSDDEGSSDEDGSEDSD